MNDLRNLMQNATKLQEVARLARSGQKIEAIKLYREIFPVGLKEAKDAVDAIAAGAPPQMHVAQATVQPQPKSDDQAAIARVIQLLQQRKKMEAIKLYVQHFDAGLNEAKDAVDALEKRYIHSASATIVPSTEARLGSESAPISHHGLQPIPQNAPVLQEESTTPRGCLAVVIATLALLMGAAGVAWLLWLR